MIFNSVIASDSGGGGATLYSINNTVPSYVSVDKSSAEEGETVTATLVDFPGSASGYRAQWLSGSASLFTVNAGKGSNVRGDTATFTMPAANVSIVGI